MSSADHGADSDRLRWARLDNLQYSAFHSLVLGEDVDWPGVFDLSQGRGLSVNDLLMSPSFLEVVRDYYHSSHKEVPFTDFLWTMRSIYLPLLVTLQFTPPEADIYHCVSTATQDIGSLATPVSEEGPADLGARIYQGEGGGDHQGAMGRGYTRISGSLSSENESVRLSVRGYGDQPASAREPH